MKSLPLLLVFCFIIIGISCVIFATTRISAKEQPMQLDDKEKQADDDLEKNFIEKLKTQHKNRNNNADLESIRREFEKNLKIEFEQEERELRTRRKQLEALILKADPIIPLYEQRFLEDPILVLNNKTKEQCAIHCPRCHKWSSMGDRCIAFGKYPTVEEMYNCSFHYFHPGELKIDQTKRELLDLAIGRFNPNRQPIQQKQIFLLAGDNGGGKTYIAHVLSLFNSQYYLRDSVVA